MALRITDLPTATSINNDDYVVIDGATDGTRKALTSSVGGEKLIDFTTSLTSYSLDSRGVSTKFLMVYPSSASDFTDTNLYKTSAYIMGSSSEMYPLVLTQVKNANTYFGIYIKSIYDDVQDTTSQTISGTLHIVAPYEISSVAQGM